MPQKISVKFLASEELNLFLLQLLFYLSYGVSSYTAWVAMMCCQLCPVVQNIVPRQVLHLILSDIINSWCVIFQFRSSSRFQHWISISINATRWIKIIFTKKSCYYFTSNAYKLFIWFSSLIYQTMSSN